MRDQSGKLPIHLSAVHGTLTAKMFQILRKAQLARSLDGSGSTLLHPASMGANLEGVQIILNHGVDVNSRGRQHIDGYHPLHLAALYDGPNNSPGIDQLLINRGASRMSKISTDECY